MNVAGTASAGGVVCPFCLYSISSQPLGTSCAACRREIPAFVQRELLDSPPLVLQLLGWSGHGKTSYLSALSFVLSRMTNVWDSYIFRAGTVETQTALATANRLVREGAFPDRDSAADGSASSPQIYLIRAMQRWGNRVVMVQDPAGQHCDTMQMPIEHLPYLLRAPVILMLLSADDLEGQDYRTMDMLLNNLIHTLESHEVAPGSPRRGMVVVLSKADLILGALPPAIRRYLVEDRLWPWIRPPGPGLRPRVPDGAASGDRLDTRYYLQEMHEMDRALRDWLAHEPPLRTLQLEAQRHQIELRFAIVSATGEDPRGRRSLPGPWRPHRVVDPLFWALEMAGDLGGVLPEQAGAGWGPIDGSSPQPPALVDGTFSLLFRDRRRHGGSRRINLLNREGSLEKVNARLKDLSFVRENQGVRFQLTSGETLYVRRSGRVEPLSVSDVLLRSGEAISTTDWEVELRAGHF